MRRSGRAPVAAIESHYDAARLTKASPCGLLAAIWTADLARGVQFAGPVHTGPVNVNELTNYWESQRPFAGRVGSDGGMPRVGGDSVMRAFAGLETIVAGPHAR